MTEYTDSHQMLFLESPSEPNMFLLGDYDCAKSSQSIGCPVNFISDDLLGNTEDLPQSVFRSKQPSPNPKVQIPRTSTPMGWSNRGRVSQACKPCHELKTKCSGHRPICHRCEELRIDCNYSDRRREKVAKRIDDLSTHIDRLENLLRDLYPRLDTQSAKHVEQTLNKIPDYERAPLLLSGLREIYAAPGVRLVTIDYIEEDFNCHREMQALGFVGEHSETAWLYRLKSALEREVVTPSSSEELIRSSVTSMNYYKTDWEMEVRDEVNVLERPEQSVADQLIYTYFRIIHPSFPLIGKTTFLDQYRTFYSDPTTRPGKRWLAVLNLVFATAAMHLSRVQNEIERDKYPHLVYFSRAWRLSMDRTSLRDHPNLQQVQVEGLAAFYLLASGQVNRSWKCCGLAIHSALAMGLNFRNESQSVAPLSKEIRYRVWWALCVLDTSLSGITGRALLISGRFSTTPLPMPFEEGDLNSDHVLNYMQDRAARSSLIAKLLDSSGQDKTNQNLAEDVKSYRPVSNKRSLDKKTTPTVAEYPPPSDSLCFFYAASLTIIMGGAIDTIYAPSAGHKSWQEIETLVSSLNIKVDNWLESLPISYQFQALSEPGSLKCQSVKLAFQFYSTKLFITRPFLARLLSSSPEDSDRSEAASHPMMATCIQSVGQLIDLLPDEPNLTWLYGHCPWWCALHYLMQAITIILTDSFIRAKLGTSDTINATQKLRKARGWLKELSKTDVSAHKAWMLSSELILHHGSRLGLGA